MISDSRLATESERFQRDTGAKFAWNSSKKRKSRPERFEFRHEHARGGLGILPFRTGQLDGMAV